MFGVITKAEFTKKLTLLSSVRRNCLCVHLVKFLELSVKTLES